jgi:uncharacterized protein DUF1707/cell wall-active antibiotic response 4TMS protein YvqF
VSNPPLPADRRHLRVSDADRDQVAEVLREAAGQGRLTLDELDQRLDQAYAAKTYADLDTVTRDLPAVGAPAPPPGAQYSDTRIGGTPGSKISIAVMSEARRSGQWVVPSTYVAFAFMGGVVLDLRQARFSEREVTIQAYAWMGGVNIIVPEDIEVDVSGIAFMGGFDHRASGPGVPGAPRVRILGFAFMGGVDVRRKAPKKRDKNGPSDSIEGGSRPSLEE